MIIYDGPSMLDGTPIIAVLIPHSSNRKTGDQAQLYILVKNVDPVTAHKQERDRAICGDCIHRVHGTCYVTLIYGPRAVYDGYLKGKYQPVNPRKAGKGLHIRLGAYGDSSALPFETVAELLADARGWSGFCHQWRTCDQRFKQFLMASVESEDGYVDARRKGWRCYRTKSPNSGLILGEYTCPASEEAGKKLTCIQCNKCNGTNGKSRANVVINAHGSSKRKLGMILEPSLIK